MLFLVLLLAAQAPAEPDAVPLAAGASAPYAGVLMPLPMAVRLGQGLETCQFVAAEERKQSKQLLAIEQSSCTQRLKLLETTTSLHANSLEQQLLAAHKATERQWWENPTLSIAIGVGAGVLLTAGAVYLAGQLSPTTAVVVAP